MHVTQKWINSVGLWSSEERDINWDWESSAECHQYTFSKGVTDHIHVMIAV